MKLVTDRYQHSCPHVGDHSYTLWNYRSCYSAVTGNKHVFRKLVFRICSSKVMTTNWNYRPRHSDHEKSVFVSFQRGETVKLRLFKEVMTNDRLVPSTLLQPAQISYSHYLLLCFWMCTFLFSVQSRPLSLLVWLEQIHITLRSTSTLCGNSFPAFSSWKPGFHNLIGVLKKKKKKALLCEFLWCFGKADEQGFHLT